MGNRPYTCLFSDLARRDPVRRLTTSAFGFAIAQRGAVHSIRVYADDPVEREEASLLGISTILKGNNAA